MPDPVTPQKALFIPINGADVGSSDGPVNANFTALDNLLGGVQAITLAGVNVTLTQTQANHLIFLLTGVLTANVELIFPAIGGFFIINNQTTGAFSVTAMTSAGGSIGTAVGQGAATPVYLDGTNAAPVGPIPSGSAMLFAQAAAPLGWTQNVSINDTVLRVVSAAGGGSHGSVGLSAFIAAGALGHALATGEMPVHTHGVNDPSHAHNFAVPASTTATTNTGGNPAWHADLGNTGATTANAVTHISIQNAGGGAAHTHAVSDLKYLDLILCVKS